MENIQLINQNKNSSNGETSCTVTMENCTVGNVLILAYAVRGQGNDPTLTDGWTKLGGGNNASDAASNHQKIYFAYKAATAETETVTITQTNTGRIYAIISEYSGVSEVIMRDDLAAYGATNYTVTGGKTGAEDAMVYAITSTYHTNGGNTQTATPEANLQKIYGDTSVERLAGWFDPGGGESEITFSTCTAVDNRDAVLECVQLKGTNESDSGTDSGTDSDTDSGATIVWDGYIIQEETLTAIADEVRRLCDTEETLTPGQMQEKLAALNIELTEEYVTPTTEEQTITPPEGYYGFSKIIVGAVDYSGDGGGGGGDGGDVGTYPSSSGISFGTETITEEVETGNYNYGDYTLSAIPSEGAYPYSMIYIDDNAIGMISTSIRPTYHGKTGDIIHLSFDSKYNWASYSHGDYTGWELHAYGTSEPNASEYRIIWANFPITDIDGETVLEFAEPTPEKETVTHEQPVEREESYLIGGEDLNSIISMAQKITGTTDPMTVEEATKALEKYYESLNEETETEETTE